MFTLPTQLHARLHRPLSRWLTRQISRVSTLSLAALSVSVSACHAQAPQPPSAEVRPQLKAALKLPSAQRQETLKRLLSPLEYHVTQEEGTERPFQNRYWDNKAPGLYVDVISGEPLFSSAHKYRSGTGWPSFDRPLSASAVREVVDTRHGMRRVEVRSASSDAHLGHVFEDGPATTGRRYCMNAAALRFVPLSALREEGYEAWIERAGLTPPSDTSETTPESPSPQKSK